MVSGQSVPAALAELLAVGPFHVALREAISASGLALDRIRYRLGLRDVSISVPTLSNWQSGRRRPERPESLRALAELEAVLDLPPAALRSLLGPPKPRGRAAHPKGANAIVTTWGTAVEPLLDGINTASDGRLTRLSQHDRVSIDASGRVVEVASRLVLRASHDGPDRWILVWDAGDAEQVPIVIAGLHCRLRQCHVDPDTRMMVAELVFDAPLGRGDTIILEYRLLCPSQPGAESDSFFRRFHRPTRDYVLEAMFDPVAPPRRCHRLDGPALVLNAAASVHMVEFNVTGTVGIRWNM